MQPCNHRHKNSILVAMQNIFYNTLLKISSIHQLHYCFFSLMSSSCVVVCVLLFSSSNVKGQKYESWVVLANAFSSEILHGLEFQGRSNEEKPMQQHLVFLPTKSQGYQINFLFAWKAGMCFFFKCRAQVSWKKPTTFWIRSCPEKVFTWKGLIGAWRPPGNF